MQKNKVAIITRTKNRPLLLKRAVESVLNQTFDNWTHIIFNDSDDKQETENVINGFKDNYKNRIIIINNEKKSKGPVLFNAGIENSDSDYIVIHDDDDSWEKDFLENTVNYLDLNKEYGGVVTHSNYILEKVEKDQVEIISSTPFNEDLKFISLYEMAIENRFPPISFLFRRECAEKIGFYNEKFIKRGDYDFNLRFLAEFDIALLSKKLANYHYRVSQESDYSNTVINSEKFISNMEYDNILRNSLLRQDMKENKLGIGFLVNIAKITENIIARSNSSLDTINNEELKDKRILFYGAGTSAELFVKTSGAKLSKLKIIGFLDQNQKLWGKNIAGYEIFSPAKIAELKPDVIIPTVVNKVFVMPFIENLIKENKLECKIIDIGC